MTTETPTRSADRGTTASAGARLLLRAAALTAMLGLVVAGVAGLVEGTAAALGALVGTALVVVVLAGGSLLLDVVAGLLPSASLLVALLTFTLQLLVVLLVLVGLERSGLLGGALDRGWLGGAVIGATMLWLAVQVRLHTTARVPAYDLPAGPPAEMPADEPRRADEGGH